MTYYKKSQNWSTLHNKHKQPKKSILRVFFKSHNSPCKPWILIWNQFTITSDFTTISSVIIFHCLLFFAISFLFFTSTLFRFSFALCNHHTLGLRILLFPTGFLRSINLAIRFFFYFILFFLYDHSLCSHIHRNLGLFVQRIYLLVSSSYFFPPRMFSNIFCSHLCSCSSCILSYVTVDRITVLYTLNLALIDKFLDFINALKLPYLPLANIVLIPFSSFPFFSINTPR